MTFTDEDLKRLKAALKAKVHPWLKGVDLSPDAWQALLARLEAAERISVAAEEALRHSTWDGEENITCPSVYLHAIYEKLSAWLKTKGEA